MLRIGSLFCTLAVCAFLNALWTAEHLRDVASMSFGLPETFSPDEAQTGALRIAVTRWAGRDLEARERRR